MADKLYKINISTDIMVYASGTKEAVELAKTKASDEIGAGSFEPIHAQYVDQIPSDWLNYIPYCPARMKQIANKCQELVVHRPISQQPVKVEPEKTEPEKTEPEKTEPVHVPQPLPLPNNPPLNFDSIVAGRRKR